MQDVHIMDEANLNPLHSGGGTFDPAPGSPSRGEWPAGSMPPGTRVTVIQDPSWDGPWQVEFRGTIDDLSAPEPVWHSLAR